MRGHDRYRDSSCWTVPSGVPSARSPPDHTPYAIQVTPYWDGGDIWFMINPRGLTRRNLEQNPNVLVKLTLAGLLTIGLGGILFLFFQKQSCFNPGFPHRRR